MMNTENKHKWSILIAVMLGSIMTPIDGSIMNIAMPTLTKVFNAPLETVSWVSMAYLLVVSNTLLMFGRVFQAIGGAMLLSMAPAILTAVYKETRRLISYQWLQELQLPLQELQDEPPEPFFLVNRNPVKSCFTSPSQIGQHTFSLSFMLTNSLKR